ncbi:MAG TPA: hypothetical protein ENO30_06450 [Thermodesulfobium narugense]|uniref:Uncharacterized protein n=1 Tax=Thermodesulfobium acidiphilum TaxID=1794699 RepID=A0A2R4W1P4_THEAF|nr:hypothetical protein [Thermodesulfobium acidiphilum]AWB10737.1 hypothetical protein TDSAC_1397 [Thermodesulfobium acidiphilum]PMP85198.1 MAG: hypothetical protein C0174_05175 [Thermodesulfobium narugense]HEM56380.1 hypothetical protein [Thermodesulfobium narugense]
MKFFRLLIFLCILCVSTFVFTSYDFVLNTNVPARAESDQFVFYKVYDVWFSDGTFAKIEARRAWMVDWDLSVSGVNIGTIEGDINKEKVAEFAQNYFGKSITKISGG